jgi:HlyD family secretion protein
MRIVVWIAAGSALLAGGCVDRAAQARAKTTQAIVTNPVKFVTVQPIATKNVSEKLEITGQVVTANDTEVNAKQPGRLVRVNVKDGDPVFAGEVIAEQDASQLQATYRQALAGVASAQSQLSSAIQNAALSPGKSAAAVRQARAQVAWSNQALKSAQANLTKVKAGGRTEERRSAEAQVRSAKANLDKAKKDLDRAQTLVNQGAAAQSQLEAAQSAFESAQSNYESAIQNRDMTLTARPEDIQIAQAAVDQARDSVHQSQEALRASQAQQKLDVLLTDAVRTAQAQVSAAQAQADAARVAIDDTKIRAPFAGKVAGRPTQAGSIAGSGTTIARIVGSEGGYFEGQVPEEQVRFVTAGRPVAVTLDALPGQTISGQVLAVSGVASNVGRLFSVRIALTGSLGQVRPGMFARGVVLVRTVAGATVVPATAIVKKNDHDTIFLAEGDKAKAVPVTRGIVEEDVVQITGAVKAGDPVIVQGQADLDDGVKIQVDKKAAAVTAQK